MSELGLCTIDEDKVFYFLNENHVLHGANLTHVDDFNISGTPDFIKKIIDHVAR